MKIKAPFLQLIRLPNLVFIIITQVLFQYCIFYPIYKNIPAGDALQFFLLVIASVFIAAAGYIINDYFDINIDLINKPDKMIIGKLIGRRSALMWHLLLSISGIILTAIAVDPFSRWYLVIANTISVILLWVYSARFKKDILIGNFIISLLTAWTIVIIFLSKFSLTDALDTTSYEQIKFFRFTILYAGFAFIISLIREAIKDIEDREGDQKYGCTTMPIIWGITTTKVYIAIWLTILITVLIIIQFYVLQFKWWIGVVYCILFIIMPLIYLFRKLLVAQTVQDYHSLSTLTKGIMLTGILSMIIFYIYL